MNFSLFLSLVCLILYRYCEEKFCLGHLWELKCQGRFPFGVISCIDSTFHCIVMLQKTEEGSLGLSSQEALKRLFDAIHDELATFRAVNQCTWRSDLWSTLSDNHHLPISFISLAFLVFEFLVMVMSYAISDKTRR